VGFAGVIAAQAVYAQDVTTATQVLNELLTTIAGIVTTITALAGGIIAIFARINQNLELQETIRSKKCSWW
jgi:hypothetical protein